MSTPVIAFIALGVGAVLVMAHITSPLAVSPMLSRLQVRLATLLVVVLAMLSTVGCAPERPEARACVGKLGRYAMYDGAHGWTSSYTYGDGELQFTPEGMSGGRRVFRLWVPCSAVTVPATPLER